MMALWGFIVRKILSCEIRDYLFEKTKKVVCEPILIILPEISLVALIVRLKMTKIS